MRMTISEFCQVKKLHQLLGGLLAAAATGRFQTGQKFIKNRPHVQLVVRILQNHRDMLKAFLRFDLLASYF